MAKHTKLILDEILDFVKVGGILPPSRPGFGHALKLSYNTMDKERLYIPSDESDKPIGNSLTYRYNFRPNEDAPTIGLLSALQDELSTCALYRTGLPAPPGASLQMLTEFITKNIPTGKDSEDFDVDVVNIITKLGRTTSHSQTQFICSKTKKLLAHATHVKYMPTGSWLMDFIWRRPFLFKLLTTILLKIKGPPRQYEEKPIGKGVIGENLEFQGIGQAKFNINNEHTNPTGAMHGGCVAMVMEKVAEPFAKEELKSDNIVLESMQVEFLGASKGPYVDLSCETIAKEECDNILHVRVLQKRRNRVVADGKLRFSKTSQ